MKQVNRGITNGQNYRDPAQRSKYAQYQTVPAVQQPEYSQEQKDYEQSYVEPEKHSVHYEAHIAYKPICKLTFGT